MLRVSLLRARPAARPLACVARPQWPSTTTAAAAAAARRCYADNQTPPVTPSLTPSSPPSRVQDATIPATEVPSLPPTPTTVAPGASRDAPAIPPAPTPPTGPGSASVAPNPASAPKKKRQTLRKLLLWLALLSGLGYAGGVWYSLVSDNFHDFFTEFVPFGEEAVAYFEEREFRRRFPGRAGQPRLHPQPAGDAKVTIPGKSGLTARLAQTEGTDLATKGPHLSAVADNKPPTVVSEPPATTPPPTKSSPPAKSPAEPRPVEKEVAKELSSSVKPIDPLDHLNVPAASEPVVQDVVKIVNDIITVINADKAHDGRYNSALDKAKSELAKVVSDINALKDDLQKTAQDQIKAAHVEFEDAARELVQRLDHQMQEQEAHWKEEYENERERLQETYRQKTQAELEAAQKVYEQKLKNQLLEQSIQLQRNFTATVRDRVEAERDGRLGKLNQLSSSVHELEKLTAEWNDVIDANLKTQHLVVAVEAVKSALDTQITPKPFVSELAALKEIAADDPVVSAAIASINPAAYQRGVPSPALLIDRFRRVASEVRKAALLPEDAGVASHIASLAMSKVLFKKSGLAVGGDVEAVRARTEILLEEGDLDAAAREMNGLQGWAKVLSKDWLGEVRRVLEVRQALDVIATEARLNSLLID